MERQKRKKNNQDKPMKKYKSKLEEIAHLYTNYLPRVHFQPRIQLTCFWCFWSKKNFACFSVSHFDWKVTHLTALIYGLRIQTKFHTIRQLNFILVTHNDKTKQHLQNYKSVQASEFHEKTQLPIWLPSHSDSQYFCVQIIFM